jgi:hypothetical protein
MACCPKSSTVLLPFHEAQAFASASTRVMRRVNCASLLAFFSCCINHGAARYHPPFARQRSMTVERKVGCLKDGKLSIKAPDKKLTEFIFHLESIRNVFLVEPKNESVTIK